MNYFSDFREIVEYRQKKIIISFTSHEKRFKFLPKLLKSIKNQTLIFNKIFLFLAEKDQIILDQNALLQEKDNTILSQKEMIYETYCCKFNQGV